MASRLPLFILALLARASHPQCTPLYTVGNGSTGSFNGPPANRVTFNQPHGVAFDASLNAIVADRYNNQLRLVSPNGTVSNFAGSLLPGLLDAPAQYASAARFNGPAGVAVDPALGITYVADTGNVLIRRVDPTGAVTTLSGSAGLSGNTSGPSGVALFQSPCALGLSPDGAQLCVAQFGGNSVRLVSTVNGSASTVIGNTSAGLAALPQPRATSMLSSTFGCAFSADSRTVYATDYGNNQVVFAAGGVVYLLAGSPTGVAGTADGVGTAAQLSTPRGVAFSALEGALYVVQAGGSSVRRVALPSGAVTTITGTYGSPLGIAVGGDGSIAVSSSAGRVYLLRCVAPPSPTPSPTPSASQGAPPSASPTPAPPPATPSTSPSYAMMSQCGVTSVAGNGTAWVGDGPALAGGVFGPSQLAFSAVGGGAVVFLDRYAHVLRALSLGTGLLSTLAGGVGVAGFANGAGSSALFNAPAGVAVNGSGWAYVADTGNARLRLVSPAGVVSTVAGGASGYVDGAASAARFSAPAAVAVGATNNVFICDWGNNVIRVQWAATLAFATLTGNGSAGLADGPQPASMLRNPHGVAANSSGWVFVSDSGNNVVRRYNPSTGVLRLLAGSPLGLFGSANGLGTSALLNAPTSLAFHEPSALLFVADTSNYRVRCITDGGLVSTLAGNGGGTSIDGWGTLAGLAGPRGVAIQPGAGVVFVGDNGRIRQLTCPFPLLYSASASPSPPPRPHPSPAPRPWAPTAPRPRAPRFPAPAPAPAPSLAPPATL